MTIGDVICQHIENRKTNKPWDKERTFRMSLVGLFVSGPLSHFTQFTLEDWFPGRGKTAIMKKMIGNFFMAPISTSLHFTAVTLLTPGKSKEDALKKVKKDTLPTLMVGLCYWPFVGFCNLRFAPVEWRPLFGSIAGVLWNIFMSNRANLER